MFQYTVFIYGSISGRWLLETSWWLISQENGHSSVLVLLKSECLCLSNQQALKSMCRHFFENHDLCSWAFKNVHITLIFVSPSCPHLGPLCTQLGRNYLIYLLISWDTHKWCLNFFFFLDLEIQSYITMDVFCQKDSAGVSVNYQF